MYQFILSIEPITLDKIFGILKTRTFIKNHLSHHLNKHRYPKNKIIQASKTATTPIGRHSPATMPMQKVKHESPTDLQHKLILKDLIICIHLNLLKIIYNMQKIKKCDLLFLPNEREETQKPVLFLNSSK